MIDAFEIVHGSGRTYNDLKPENVMVDTDNGNDGQVNIVLIDFGFAAKFIDKDYNHVCENQEKESFRGNILFSSWNQMNFKITSRRDDLISLANMMLYMLNK